MPKKEYKLFTYNGLWLPSFSSLSPKTKAIVDDKIVNQIQQDPYHNTEYLRMELEGLRSYNRLETDNRIIFAICEECRKNGFDIANNCESCKDIPDNAIMLFACDGHELYKRLGRQRSKAVEKARKLRLGRRH
jgi:Txe/YoeB family toxin of Txe-Axe toxin-antitoxin module